MPPRRPLTRLVPNVDGLEARLVMAAPPGLVASLVAAPDGPGVIKLVLTETNTTDQALPVDDGVGNAVTDFWLSQGGRELWRLRLDEPMLNAAIRKGVPLAPGASRSFTYEWHGQVRRGAAVDPSQPLTFHAEVDDATAEAVTTPPIPAVGGGNGGTAGVGTTPQVDPLSIRITADRSTYRQGRPVVLTITETNLGLQPLAVKSSGPDALSISRGGVTIWTNRPLRLVSASALTTLAPGQSRTFQVVWNGMFSQNARQPRTGQFTASVVVDGRPASLSLTIARR